MQLPPGSLQQIPEQMVARDTHVGKILIVDDDLLVLNSLDETLRREGYDVLKADSAHEALALLKSNEVALIICDQTMPVISGVEILRQAQLIRPDAVRIALTGSADRDVVINAINVGQVSQFISKPWENVLLRRIVSGTMEKYRLLQENKNLQHLIFGQNVELEKINQVLRYEMLLGAQIHKELLLGKVPLDMVGIAIGATTVPSKEIDGDFFDFYRPVPHVVDVVIGDVMGKGLPAALVGTAIKTQLQRFAVPLNHAKYCDRNTFWVDDLSSPRDILMRAHGEIARQLIDLEYFVSLFYGRFDLMKKTFSFVDCGSTKPIHHQASDGSVRFLKGPDFPVGMVEENNYHEFETPFEAEDLFVFYSDGVTESRSPEGELYGIDRLVQVVQRHGARGAEEVLEEIKKGVLEHAQKGRFDDDLTLVVVKLAKDNPFHPIEPLSAAYLSDLSQLADVRAFVKRICIGAPGDADALNLALELAVNESFCNIVQHGYNGDLGQRIYLQVKYQEEGLWLELSDQGDCFNPGVVPEPGLADYEEGGYGMYIIRQLADQLVYLPKSTPDGWNHLRIYKRYIFKEVPMEFTHTAQGSVLVVTPTGLSLDAREAREFKDKVNALIKENDIHSIVIDMRNLQFIDSSGLGTFLSILKALHAQGGDLKLANLNKPIRTIFELVSMHKIFEIYNTNEEAVLSFR